MLNPPPPMAIKVHAGRFIRKMTFDMKAPPVAIKVHTGRFIRKMTFDMKDVPVTCSNSDTNTALTMIRYSLPLATRFLHPPTPMAIKVHTRQIYKEDDI